jgi:hypothetical protein
MEVCIKFTNYRLYCPCQLWRQERQLMQMRVIQMPLDLVKLWKKLGQLKESPKVVIATSALEVFMLKKVRWMHSPRVYLLRSCLSLSKLVAQLFQKVLTKLLRPTTDCAQMPSVTLPWETDAFIPFPFWWADSGHTLQEFRGPSNIYRHF